MITIIMMIVTEKQEKMEKQKNPSILVSKLPYHRKDLNEKSRITTTFAAHPRIAL